MAKLLIVGALLAACLGGCSLSQPELVPASCPAAPYGIAPYDDD